MIKSLLEITVAIALLAGVACNSYKTPDATSIPISSQNAATLPSSSCSLEQVLGAPPSFTSPYAGSHGHRIMTQLGNDSKANQTYLLENLKEREDLCKLVKGHDKGVAYIKNQIASLQHTYRNDAASKYYDERNPNLDKLSVRQLLRLMVLLEALNGTSTRQIIGQQIAQDLDNPYTELGGAVYFNSTGGLEFRLIPSSEAEKKERANNTGYYHPNGIMEKPYLFEYHLHAVRNEKGSVDNSAYAGPSAGGGLSKGDLEFTDRLALETGDASSLIVTCTGDGTFNIDFVGRDYAKRAPLIVLDIGNFDY